MTITKLDREAATATPKTPVVDMKLEVVVIPVSDVERAKRFYGGLGWRLDADFVVGDTFRGVQFTPPGSPCSIHFGTGLTSAVPGSVQGLFLVVSDIEAARAALADRGVDVSEAFHRAGPGKPPLSGPHPERSSYASFATFSDPDGNGWLLQEVTVRLPGRVDADETTFTSSTELAAALRRAGAAHGEHEKRTGGQRDENWPDWYAEVHGRGAGRQATAYITAVAAAYLPETPGKQRGFSMDESEAFRRIDHGRRRFLGAAAIAMAAAEFGIIGPANAQSKPETNNSFGPLKQIDAGVLNVGYADAGPADGPPVLLLHGWPYDIRSYVDVVPLLASKGYRVIVPYLRGYGTTHFLSSETVRNGQQAVIAVDIIALMDALKFEKAILAGYDWGARTANIIAALWPERCKALVSVSGYLIGSREANKMPLPPKAELAWWYQYYFATERGRAGYEANRHGFNKLIWQLASPKWDFDDATFDRSAASFDNPDHASIVIHNYRWRLSLADGEPKYDDLERRLADGPVITVPTITLEGDANGAPHPDASAYAKKFSGKYAHRIITGGVGHNLPQEAPQPFAETIVEVDGF